MGKCANAPDWLFAARSGTDLEVRAESAGAEESGYAAEVYFADPEGNLSVAGPLG